MSRCRIASNLQPRYNIAPTTMIDVFRLGADGYRELVSMRWGLVAARTSSVTPPCVGKGREALVNALAAADPFALPPADIGRDAEMISVQEIRADPYMPIK